jgi:hypothetical protein
VELGEQAGIIGRIERIHNDVADVVAQSPEEHSGMVFGVALRELMLHFLAGDHVKDRWSDRAVIVVTVDNDDKKLTFLNKETNEEVSFSHHLPPSLTISGPVGRYIDPRCAILQFPSPFFPFYSRSFCRVSRNSWCDSPGMHIASIRRQRQSKGRKGWESGEFSTSVYIHVTSGEAMMVSV